MDEELDNISLGSMDKLDKKTVIYVQMLRINKTMSEGEIYAESAIRTLESILKADIEALTEKNGKGEKNWYDESLKALITATNNKINDIQMKFRDRNNPTKDEITRVDKIQFEFLARKYELLTQVMSKRMLWGREAIEDTVESYAVRENHGKEVVQGK